MLCLLGATLTVAVREPLHESSVWDLLYALDSFLNPGIPRQAFRGLLVACRRCGYVMTERVFQFHECRMQRRDQRDNTSISRIIDISSESE